MSRIIVCLALVAGVLLATNVYAKDKIQEFPVDDVLNNPEYASQLKGVRFYFGDTAHPPVVQTFGEYRTNKKTNAFNKEDKEACDWVFLSAIMSLHQRAQSLGANAVINIRSNFKNNETRSDTNYTCGAGFAMAGVALIGDFVKVEE